MSSHRIPLALSAGTYKCKLTNPHINDSARSSVYSQPVKVEVRGPAGTQEHISVIRQGNRLTCDSIYCSP